MGRIMRELWGFIRWQCSRLELWQWAFILASFMQGVGWTLGGDWGQGIALSGLGIILVFFVKWGLWDTTRDSWAKYKKHRNELLTTIKTSDER